MSSSSLASPVFHSIIRRRGAVRHRERKWYSRATGFWEVRNYEDLATNGTFVCGDGMCRGLPDLQPDAHGRGRIQAAGRDPTEDGVTASVVVLTAEEAQAAFDCKLNKKKIQPVWLEITNDTEDEMLFMPRSIDPDYFAPLEVAQKTSWRWSKKANTEKKWFYYENVRCPSSSRRERPCPASSSPTEPGACGGCWSRCSANTRKVHVEFVTEVPGFKADFHKLDTVISTPSSLPGSGDHRFRRQRWLSKSGWRNNRRPSPTPTAARRATRSIW